MKKYLRLAGWFGGVACLAACTRPAALNLGATQAPACCQSRYPRAALPQASTQQLGREYLRLKRLKCATCSYYGSDFQLVLKALGTQLDGQPLATIKRTMGKPDETTGGELLYYWRGRHDYLRFQPQADGTAVSSWYYALE